MKKLILALSILASTPAFAHVEFSAEQVRAACAISQNAEKVCSAERAAFDAAPRGSEHESTMMAYQDLRDCQTRYLDECRRLIETNKLAIK